MPASRFVSARQLKPLLVYLAVAFVALLVLAEIVPAGSRGVVVALWIVLFPVGGWFVFRRT